MYEVFREELTPTLLKLFQKIVAKETLPSSLYKATNTLIIKSYKDIIPQKKENYRPMPLMKIDAKFLNKILNLTTH